MFFGERNKNPLVEQISSPFCTAAVTKLKAGPDNIPNIIANGTKYADSLFTGKNMVWWEGDTTTTLTYTNYSSNVNSGNYIFRDWTSYLKSTTDLFYPNGTISFNQIN